MCIIRDRVKYWQCWGTPVLVGFNTLYLNLCTFARIATCGFHLWIKIRHMCISNVGHNVYCYYYYWGAYSFFNQDNVQYGDDNILILSSIYLYFYNVEQHVASMRTLWIKIRYMCISNVGQIQLLVYVFLFESR